MPKHISNTIIICTFTLCASAQKVPWQDPEIISINKEEPKATFYNYDSKEQALKSRHNFADLESYQSLNGSWQFKWSKNPTSKPSNFFNQENVSNTSWSTIAVPSNWELQGFGTPIYVSDGMLKTVPPNVPEDDNPVGSYRRTFTIPADWDKKEVMLHFAGVSSAMYVWINGKQVGYSEGSRVPAEFIVTDLV